MLSLRTHVIICVGFFAALLIFGWGGQMLQASGIIRDPAAMKWPALVVMSLLLLGLMFSAIPVMVMLVLGFQKHVGNENLAAVEAAIRQQKTIIYVLWALIGVGLLVAIPGAYFNGAFDSTDATKPPQEIQDTNTGPSIGALVARPGMTIAEMRSASSPAVWSSAQRTRTGAIASGIVFDFTIAGTNMTFPRSRYYFASTSTADPQRIQSLNIGTSTFRMNRAALDASVADLRGKLAADGWLAGHEEYKTEEDQALHGGVTRGPEGDIWQKNGMVLHIETRRMDDPTAGEDASTAGEWIQTISLWGQKDYPYIDRYAFAPPAR